MTLSILEAGSLTVGTVFNPQPVQIGLACRSPPDAAVYSALRALAHRRVAAPHATISRSNSLQTHHGPSQCSSPEQAFLACLFPVLLTVEGLVMNPNIPVHSAPLIYDPVYEMSARFRAEYNDGRSVEPKNLDDFPV